MSFKIGRQERLRSVRDVWERESDFSNWLTTEDGVALLLESFGIEVENLNRESRPGDFPCDLAGHLEGDEEHIVVIENQYGRTNHDHLGKLLTYAAVHKATTGIWIAERVSDDHRQVIDWLNDNTPPTVNLYLAELRLFRIGQSDPAPQLDVICRPNPGVKETKRVSLTALSDQEEWLRAKWAAIHTALEENNAPFRLSHPGKFRWSKIRLGRPRFHVSMLLDAKKGSIGIQLMIQPEWKEQAYRQLFAQKGEIETALGQELIWLEKPGKKDSRIILQANLDPANPANDKAVIDWFVQNTPNAHKVFQDRVASLVQPGS